jgi:hypothetical protein
MRVDLVQQHKKSTRNIFENSPSVSELAEPLHIE